ncbi:MAG: hypothetical protein QOI98_1311 [Solirubrobacteraceae bacterium]|jgi:hypothetical protein|nr:hypothetical protein [Solirubrobacteraceae bacterium]
MTRTRRLVALGGLLALAPAAFAAGAGAQAAPQSQTSFFRSMLLADHSTAPGVARLLRTQSGFVEPNVIFADLTGDTKSDAVVRVGTPGAAGTVAVYVFSTDGVKPDSKGNTRLRAVYRNQTLYRASAQARTGALVLRAPRYKAGEEFWNPATLVEREYLWRASDHRLHLRSSREIAGPGASPAAQP